MIYSRRYFYDEIVRTEEWYNSILYVLKSNDLVIEKLIIEKNKKINNNQKSEYKEHKKQTLMRYLNDSTLIRLISNYEKFLVDTVALLYKNDIGLLRKKKKSFEITYNELGKYQTIDEIWQELVERECYIVRGLNYNRIEKYYLNNFNIIIAENNISKRIEWYFDARNIIVHRLGKIDKFFKKKYNINESYINITNENILDFLDIIKNISIKIDKLIKKNILRDKSNCT
jgi:hypothetical protein